MKRYQLSSIITSWIVFAIALTVYLLTLEPTVSYWDCGEIIAAAAGLEIGHPPGAPVHMLLGRLFSLLAPDSSNTAMMVNALSAVASAFTVFFLYKTISWFAEKMPDIYSSEKITWTGILSLGTAAIGALTFAFTDSFWFSAVEGEIYALSSFFTAITFWSVTRWERIYPKAGSDRWLIFIALLTGLSMGVHLLNLLALPAIALV